ncbi:MAG: extracellular solute-binding protein, partial [Clostridia bacterium]|nr:extracellular solute-binding protein [Clostridia bacterium]
MKKILSLVLVLAMIVIAGSAFAEEKITLNVWSFTNELEGMIEKYYKPSHPNVEIKYTIYPTDNGEYTSKVDTIMAADAAGAEAPDIFTLEAAFVKKYVNSDVTADLMGTVGITEEEVAAAIPVMKQIGTSNVNGKLKGLSWQATPGALMYRASLAEKYLGVTTPEEMQEKVADWDTFMETAEELNEASEGAVKMVVGAGDIWNAYQYNRTQGWVV